ncbi:MAG: hypothetical protein JW940_29965 [Polyangiaceae bacterium]|nr:hypothetical protein [Polyangiaceae bacterium]
MHSARTSFACALISVGFLVVSTRPARADTVDVSPTGKGIVGGALLGAEAVTATEAALHLKPAWAYLVGGGAGAAAGGVGGYFLEKHATSKTNMLVLAAGMLLVIPTTVAILSATAYEPPRDYTEDRGPTDEPLAEPAAPDQPPPVPSETPSARSTMPSLVGVTSTQLSLSVPAVEVLDMYSARERLQFGMKQQTEVRVPVLSVVF